MYSLVMSSYFKTFGCVGVHTWMRDAAITSLCFYGICTVGVGVGMAILLLSCDCQCIMRIEI